MRITKLIALTSTIAVLATQTGVVVAQSATPGAKRTVTQEQRMANLKTRADTEINRRLTTLNNLSAKINASTKLTAADKTTLATVISTDITNLTALKAKIDADTDLEVLRTDVQAVVKDYRVYALVVPKAALLLSADKVMATVDKIAALQTKLQDRITQAKNAGVDVSAMNTALADMQTKLADAKAQVQAAHDSVISLTPDGYPGNKPTLLAGRKDLQAARLDLVAASQDAKTILQALRAANILNKTATPSAR